jgi:hypothetical protein
VDVDASSDGESGELTRPGAGFRLAGMVALWLVAWLPLAIYCALAFALLGLAQAVGLRRPRELILSR